MSREAACISYCVTVCFALLIFPSFLSIYQCFIFSADEFLLTYAPSESQENWSGPLEDVNSAYAHHLPFRRLTRNTGGDEARYQIRHVGDLPMFRFG
ncbi:unnamed protein product [Litomosoides sigmodontis]|uniref:Uncharacterized protein n=1 Tax=Litomosoides sigmodontis TaxID=42156 RepID=A0A3P6SMK0_LITSI|nr:unnamed protein product [Litomosoides sigmodontis]